MATDRLHMRRSDTRVGSRQGVFLIPQTGKSGWKCIQGYPSLLSEALSSSKGIMIPIPYSNKRFARIACAPTLNPEVPS